MIKMIGLCSVTFCDKKIEEIIRLAKEAELEVIEWGSDNHVPETDIDHANNVADMMEKANLQTSSYGTYYLLGSFADFEPYIKVAKILGASLIRVWAGDTGSKETDGATRKHIVKDAKRIGDLANAEGLKVTIEYHKDTLTDTPASAEKLMREINTPHVLLYWQPAESLSVKERIDSLPKLAPWITNVHVFHWEDFYNRFPLADGYDEWERYIEIITDESPQENNFLLEFVPGEDQVQGFYDNAETLKKLIK